MQSNEQPIPSQQSNSNPGQQPNMSAGNNADELLRRASKEAPVQTPGQQTFQPGQAATPAGQTDGLRANTKPKSKKRLIVTILVVLAMLLALMAAGLYYYFYYYQPKMALNNYLTKLSNAKSAQFSGTASVTSPETTEQSSEAQSNPLAMLSVDGLLSSSDLKINGSYDFKETGNPKLGLKIVAKSGAISKQDDLNGEVVVADKTAYIKLDTPELLSVLGVEIGRDWYKMDITSTFSQTTCLFSKSANASLVNTIVPLNMPIKNAKRQGMSTTLEGKKVQHFTGEIEVSKMQAAIDEANKNVSAECKLNLKANQFENNIITYELWNSAEFDRIKVTRKNTKTDVTQSMQMDTNAYGKSVTIDVPEKASDLKAVLEKITARLKSQTQSSGTTATSEQLAQLTAARKQQLTQLSTMLATWRKTAGKYPNPGVDWLNSSVGTSAKGTFGTTYVKDTLKDPVTNKTYAYAMVSGSTLPTCKASSAGASTPTIYYQSLTKTTFTLRVCNETGTATDVKNP